MFKFNFFEWCLFTFGILLSAALSHSISSHFDLGSAGSYVFGVAGGMFIPIGIVKFSRWAKENV